MHTILDIIKYLILGKSNPEFTVDSKFGSCCDTQYLNSLDVLCPSPTILLFHAGHLRQLQLPVCVGIGAVLAKMPAMTEQTYDGIPESALRYLLIFELTAG